MTETEQPSGDRRGRMRRRTVLQLVIAVVAAGAIAAWIVVDNTKRAAPPAGQAPGTASLNHDDLSLTFDLPAFGGGRLTSASLLGKPAVVNFYASWCAICDFELPGFQKVSQEFAGRVSVVGVNPQSNDTDDKQAQMIARNHVSYRTARDAHDDMLRIFNTSGALPTTVFLDDKGVVRDREQGTMLQPAVEAKLKELFGLAPAAG